LRKSGEHGAGHAHLALHADAYHRHFGHIAADVDFLHANLAARRLDCFGGARGVPVGTREHNVLTPALARLALYDHDNIDVRICEPAEALGGDAWMVLHPQKRHLGLVARISHTRNDLFFHDLILTADDRAGIGRPRLHETRQDTDGHALGEGQLHRP